MSLGDSICDLSAMIEDYYDRSTLLVAAGLIVELDLDKLLTLLSSFSLALIKAFF